jgi:hypothetical protein
LFLSDVKKSDMDIVQVKYPLNNLLLSSKSSHGSAPQVHKKASKEHEESLPDAPTDSLLESDTRIAQSVTDSSILEVPPTTPASHYSFQNRINLIPLSFPKLDQFKLPYIREVGIKTCIDILSEYFACKDYKLNAVQFWFLDVITDCLWKVQDEFQFPEPYQKIIVEWILFVVDLIRGLFV